MQSKPRLALVTALGLLCALALAAPASALEQQISVTGDDLLGLSSAVQGDTLVLGAPRDANSTGAAYVYQRTGDTWTPLPAGNYKLTATPTGAHTTGRPRTTKLTISHN